MLLFRSERSTLCGGRDCVPAERGWWWRLRQSAAYRRAVERNLSSSPRAHYTSIFNRAIHFSLIFLRHRPQRNSSPIYREATSVGTHHTVTKESESLKFSSPSKESWTAYLLLRKDERVKSTCSDKSSSQEDLTRKGKRGIVLGQAT